MFGLFKKKSAQPVKLFYNTDIHCHIVPGIDDGSQSPETSVELVSRLTGWGITRIVTTPHVTEDTFENTPEIIDKAFDMLTDALKREGIKIDISHSAEYRIDNFFLEQLKAGNVKPLPSNYLLVENSFMQEPWELDKLLFDLKLKGFRPVLAHPERYLYYHARQQRYNELHNAGTLFQVNLLSLAGYYGKDVKKVADYLLDNSLIDFLGSDMHNHRHADAIDDFLRSKDYQRIAERLGRRLLNDRI